MSRIVTAAASAGTILQLPSPGLNATWETTMRGPAVQCMSIDAHDPFWDALQRNVRSYLDSTSNNHIGYNEIGRMFTYLSWTNSNSSDLPFVYSNPDSAEGVMELQAQLNTGNESYTRELNLAVFPRANILASGRPPPQVWNESSGITDELMDYYFEDATLLYCRLAAVERLIRFTFNGTDQAQYIEVLKTSKFKTLVRERILGLALLDSGEEDVPLDFDAIKINDASSVVYSGFGGSDRGWIILEQVAFQAVWGAFRTLIVGQMDSVSSQLIFLADPELNTYANRSRLYPTQVLSTSLAQTEDLHLLNTLTPSTSNRDVPDLLKSHVRGDQYLGLLPPKDASTFGYSQNAPRKSLKDGIEELFWNISISMASSPDLLYVVRRSHEHIRHDANTL